MTSPSHPARMVRGDHGDDGPPLWGPEPVGRKMEANVRHRWIIPCAGICLLRTEDGKSRNTPKIIIHHQDRYTILTIPYGKLPATIQGTPCEGRGSCKPGGASTTLGSLDALATRARPCASPHIERPPDEHGNGPNAKRPPRQPEGTGMEIRPERLVDDTRRSPGMHRCLCAALRGGDR
jgi:hypothetical protein